MTHLPRLALSRLVALLIGIAPALGLLPLVPTLTADAFNPPIHIAMFEQALGNTFSAEARGWVAEGLTRSDDNVAGQGRPEWHFDSANSPTAICNRWRAGPDALLTEAERQAVEAFRIVPTDAPGFDRLGTHRAEALRFYGQYLHAIQDFYTHTNWIELHLDPTTQVTLTSIPPLAPIQKGCDVQAMPKELQSGLFDFNTSNLFTTISSGAPDFCGPVTAPRPPQNSGFRYCHGPPHPETIEAILSSIPNYLVTMLNLQAGRDVSMRTLESKFMLSKDLPDLDHGAELLLRSDGTLATYHEEAVRLATEATPETFDVFRQRVVTALGASPELQNRDPDCLFQVLIRGGDPTCPQSSLFKGDAAPPHAPMVAEFWGPGGDLKVIAMHAEIRLGAARTEQGLTITDIAEGSLSYQVEILEAGQVVQIQSFTMAPGTPSAGVRGQLFTYDTITVGVVTFTGTNTIQWPPGDPSPIEGAEEEFGLAMTEQGQFVLCRTEIFTGFNYLEEMQTARQDCQAKALVVLEPDTDSMPVVIT